MNILIEKAGAKLPCINYGGTERVVWHLAKELHKMGHHVYLLAGKGSSCPFADVIVYEKDKALCEQIPPTVDVVHLNSLSPIGLRTPYIFTMHGNHSQGTPDINTVFVSRNHAERHGSRCYVYNGMDWDDYGAVDFHRPRTYFHFLGNAAWRVKNVRGAINTIKAVPGARLKVLGGHRFNFKMGLRFTFTPRASFEGMVGGVRKSLLLNGSRGLVFPVKWDEPFGIAITESLYFGCPVFATPYGSLPELVKADVGFLTTSQSDMASHIANDYHYDAKVCHEYACDLFNSRLMAERYVALYEKVLNGQPLNTQPLHKAETRETYAWED